jgi:mannosyltransferase
VYGWRLGVPSPWRDEAATLEISRRSIGGILAVTRHVDLVHLAYYLLCHLLLTLHDSVTVLRAVSVAAMAGSSALLVPIGRRLGSTRTGVLAGLLLVAGPHASRWGQDARPFALATLAAVISTLLLLRAFQPGRWRWTAYAASVCLVAVLNVLVLLVLLTHAVAVLLLARPSVRRWTVAVAGALAVCAPFLVLTFRQRDQVAWIPVPGVRELIDVYALAFGGKAGLALALAVVLGAAAAARRPAPGSTRGLLVVSIAWAVVPVLALWLLSQLHPLWDTHYLLFTAPGLALGIAAGTMRAASLVGRAWTSRVSPTAVTGTAAGLVLVAFAVLGAPAQRAYRTASGHQDDLRGVADYLSTSARPGDVVLYAPFKLRVIGSIYPWRTRNLRDVALASSPTASSTLHGIELDADSLRARLVHEDHAWVVHGTFGSLTRADELKLRLDGLGYRLVGEHAIGTVTVSEYRLAHA